MNTIKMPKNSLQSLVDDRSDKKQGKTELQPSLKVLILVQEVYCNKTQVYYL